MSRGVRRETHQIQALTNAEDEQVQMKNILGEVVHVDDTPPNALIEECEAEFGAEVSLCIGLVRVECLLSVLSCLLAAVFEEEIGARGDVTARLWQSLTLVLSSPC